MYREHLQHGFLGDEAVVYEHAAQLAAGLFLLGQRRLQLRLRDELLLYQQIPDTDPGALHCRCHVLALAALYVVRPVIAVAAAFLARLRGRGILAVRA